MLKHLRCLFGISFSLFAVLNIVQPLSTYAHGIHYGAINTDLIVQNNEVLLSTNVPQKITADTQDNETARKLSEEYFDQNFIVALDSKKCDFKLKDFSYPDEKHTLYKGVFTCNKAISGIDALQFHGAIFSTFFTSYDHFINVDLNGTKTKVILTPDNLDYPKGSTYSFNSSNDQAENTQTQSPDTEKSSENNRLSLTNQFIKMGVMHIWTGYDHILFLLSAILLLRSLRKILIIVTSFTVAHSITLILAGLQVITLSPRVVEPLIALTIIFVSTQNFVLLKNKKEDKMNLKKRWALTSGFGLIHGLGFAGALLETGIPQNYFVPSLIFFNVGVELGQLSLLVFMISLLFFIDSLKQRRKILMIISIGIILISSFWLIERIL